MEKELRELIKIAAALVPFAIIAYLSYKWTRRPMMRGKPCPTCKDEYVARQSCQTCKGKGVVPDNNP